MSRMLTLASAEDLADLGTYALRAKGIDADGAMRLQGFGAVLAASVGIRPGTGLLGAGTMIGLRFVALAYPSDVDVTVPLSAITDRTARGGVELAIPPVTVVAPWAALTPPRSGWTPTEDTTDPDQLAAARALGFVPPGEQPTLHRNGRWIRLSTTAGHVLLR